MAGECNLKRRPARLEAQGAQPAASDCGPPAAAAAAAPPQDLQAAAAPAAAQAGLDSAQLEAAAACRFDSLLQLFPLLMHGATQAATLRGWRGMPGSEVFQRVTSTLLVGLFWVLPTFFPAFYMRRRTLSILLSRASFFAWPLLRKPRGGAGPRAGRAHRCRHCCWSTTCLAV